MMSAIKRTVGGALFLYAIAYTAQAVFHDFYEDVLDPQAIWDVFNVITGAGILISIAAAFANSRTIDQADAAQRLSAQAGIYSSLALAIIFFPHWFSLLVGDTPSEAKNVGWLLVSFLNPLVLATTGIYLWRTPEARRGMAASRGQQT